MLSGVEFLTQLRGDRIQREVGRREETRQTGTYEGHDSSGRLKVRLIDQSIAYVYPANVLTIGSLSVGQIVNVIKNGSQNFIDAPQPRNYQVR